MPRRLPSGNAHAPIAAAILETKHPSAPVSGSGLFMLTSPWIYLAIIALCTLVREVVRSWSRHRDIACLLKMTHDPTSLRYLVQMEEARRPWLMIQRPSVAEDSGPSIDQATLNDPCPGLPPQPSPPKLSRKPPG
jgi:hypothetical protein